MAIGAGTFTALGGAVSDLFAVGAHRTKAAGNRLQAEQYEVAKGLSLQNKQFAETSTEIKEMQAQRAVYMALGQQQAEVAASGFEASGSALDLLRDSAAQGALQKAVLSQQGLIEEASYEAQAKSYAIMAESARMAADAEDRAAIGSGISGALKAAASIATLGTFDLGSFAIEGLKVGEAGGGGGGIGIGGGVGW